MLDLKFWIYIFFFFFFGGGGGGGGGGQNVLCEFDIA